METDSTFYQINKALVIFQIMEITPTKIRMSENAYGNLIEDTSITVGRGSGKMDDSYIIFGLPIEVTDNLPEDTNWIIETEES